MKAKTWVKRWAVSESSSGLVNFYHNARARSVDSVAQMQYSTFLLIFGILLEPEKSYSLKVKATAMTS